MSIVKVTCEPTGTSVSEGDLVDAAHVPCEIPKANATAQIERTALNAGMDGSWPTKLVFLSASLFESRYFVHLARLNFAVRDAR
jgi:hypothetical protein